jgi:hypothetical protein
MVYLNSWGEMFCESRRLKASPMTLARVKKEILKQINLTAMPGNTKFIGS